MSPARIGRLSLVGLASELRTEVGRLWWHLRRPATRSGITPTQMVALSVLAKHPEGLRQGDLADLMNVSPASMTRLLELMQEPGWVARTRDESDLRAVLVRLTDEGRSALELVGDEATAQLAELLGDLSLEEIAAIEAALPVLRKLGDLHVKDPSGSSR